MAIGRHRLTLTTGQRLGAAVAAALLLVGAPLLLLFSAPPPPAVAAPADAPAKAIAWAQNQQRVNPNSYYMACLGFVADAYRLGAGVSPTGGWATNSNTTAYEFWQHFPQLQHPKDANPPAGAFVFWAPNGYDQGAGHVALSLGGQQVISTYERKTTTIHTFAIADRAGAANYLGWMMPPGITAGSTAPTAPTGGGGVPFGHLDSVTRAPGGLRAQGWVIDPDTANPIDAHAYSGNGNPGGGNPGAATRAERNRPDVARAYPGKGAAHGFDLTVAARAAGAQTVCIYGINVGGGNTNPRIGCATVNVSPDPYGALDVVTRVPGGVQARGWAIDPDSGAPIAVHVYGGNGRPGGGPGVATTADQDRPDVGAVYPNYGSRHGYTVFLPTGPQPQTFCAYGINNGPGSNPGIGCRTV